MAMTRPPESASRRAPSSSYGLFLDGKFTDPESYASFETLNPATRYHSRASLRHPSRRRSRRGLVATGVREVWSKTTGASERSISIALRDSFRSARGSWRSWRHSITGKAIPRVAHIDILWPRRHFFYYAGWADKLDYAGRWTGTENRSAVRGFRFIPWNFRCSMAAWKLAPALATREHCVLKARGGRRPLGPPLGMLGEILQQAELPPGVVNIVDRRRIGAAPHSLITPTSTRIAFTGSTEWDDHSTSVASLPS